MKQSPMRAIGEFLAKVMTAPKERETQSASKCLQQASEIRAHV